MLAKHCLSVPQRRFVGGTVKPRERWPDTGKRGRKGITNAGHAAVIVGSPSFVKASVLCRLPNQREHLKHSFVGAKPGGRPHSQSNVSKIISFFITRSGRNFLHEKKSV